MEIYAELTRKIQEQLDDGKFHLRLPPGVEFVRKKGSRALYIECADDEETVDIVKELLYESGIPFQADDIPEKD